MVPVSEEKDRPYYRLAEIHSLLAAEHRRIRTEVLTDANNHFGLDREGIYDLVAKLTEADWYKSMPAANYPGVVFDVYHATVDPPGVVAYIKFYIDDERNEVVIQSCKKK